jgi:hypothetical protein
MTADLDTTRIVRAWLRTDEHESAERLLAQVVAALDTTPQHRTRWPAWRVRSMNLDAKLAIYAVAVLAVVAFVMNLLPSGGPGLGGSASESPSPSPSVGPSASPIGDIWTRGVPIALGRHEARINDIAFSFEVPAEGWSSDPMWTGMLLKGPFPAEDSGWVGFTWSFDRVATSPCAGASTSVGPTIDDLATAMTTIPGTTARDPVDTMVGGLPAKVVEYTIDDDISCEPRSFWLYGEGSAYPDSVDSTIKEWVVEVDGQRTGVHTDRIGPSPELEQEMQQIVDSIRWE